MRTDARAPPPPPEAGRGRGPGSGSGSLPSPVLFEPGLTGMGYSDRTRSAIRIRTDSAQRMTENRHEQLGSFCLKRTVATVQTDSLQPFGRVHTVLPSWSAINSAPFLSFKHTTNGKAEQVSSSAFRSGNSP